MSPIHVDGGSDEGKNPTEEKTVVAKKSNLS